MFFNFVVAYLFFHKCKEQISHQCYNLQRHHTPQILNWLNQHNYFLVSHQIIKTLVTILDFTERRNVANSLPLLKSSCIGLCE